jgi:hypothetical protein
MLVVGCAGCGTYTEYQGDRLTENPIDHVFKSDTIPDDERSTYIRHYLLEHVPPEANSRALRAYLESLGAKCADDAQEIVCRYRLWIRSRTDRYLLAWRYTEGEFTTTEYVVTITAPAGAMIGKDVPVEIVSRVMKN